MRNENLPEGWAWTTINEITFINPGLNRNIVNSPEVSFLPMKSVEEKSGKIDLSEIKNYEQVKKGYTPFIDGDLLFAKITPCMENGKIAIAHNLKNGIGFGSTEFHVIRLVDYKMPQNLLFFFLSQENYRKEAKRNMTGTAGQLRVPADYLKNTIIPLPPLPEQRRIVDKLEELFSRLEAGVEELKQAQSKLKRYRQAVLKSAFEGKLTESWREKHKDKLEPASQLLEKISEERKKQGKSKELPPLDTSDLPALPEGWAWTRLGDIIEPSNQKVNPLKIESKPYIGLEHIEKHSGKLIGIGISEETKSTKTMFYAGDLLYGKLRPYLNKVFFTNFDGVCSTDILVFSKKNFISNKFLAFRLLNNDFVNYASQNVSGVQHPRIDFKTISYFVIPLPSLPEQEQIAAEIERLFSIAEEIEKFIRQSLKQADRLRQSILHRAFTGRLLPQNPNDEPASKLLERIRAAKAQTPAKTKANQLRKAKNND